MRCGSPAPDSHQRTPILRPQLLLTAAPPPAIDRRIQVSNKGETMSSLRAGALTALLLVCGLGGCTTARQIQVTQDGGCVAIPENTDIWPTNYRTKAMDLIKKQCPQGYVIVREEEVVTGKVRTDSEATDTQTQDVSSRRRPNATLTTTST